MSASPGRIAAAIFLPPLGVYFARGAERDFWAGGAKRDFWAGGAKRDFWAGGAKRDFWAGGAKRDFWADGAKRDFWIACGLTVLGWLPGAAFALWVVLKGDSAPATA